MVTPTSTVEVETIRLRPSRLLPRPRQMIVGLRVDRIVDEVSTRRGETELLGNSVQFGEVALQILKRVIKQERRPAFGQRGDIGFHLAQDFERGFGLDELQCNVAMKRASAFLLNRLGDQIVLRDRNPEPRHDREDVDGGRRKQRYLRPHWPIRRLASPRAVCGEPGAERHQPEAARLDQVEFVEDDPIEGGHQRVGTDIAEPVIQHRVEKEMGERFRRDEDDLAVFAEAELRQPRQPMPQDIDPLLPLGQPRSRPSKRRSFLCISRSGQPPDRRSARIPSVWF